PTLYLPTPHPQPNILSFIHTNYIPFPSPLLLPPTPIPLQNPPHNFSLDPSHPNPLHPHKQTYHAISADFLTRNNETVPPF
ncbi:gamma-glutamyltransferase, partial [Paenibacillus xylanexedens]|uniref:gamma-glutamyltransferase n=1 Tax=Paenibacillus xylanexedens TaxID=528191 RepID=UPI0016427025